MNNENNNVTEGPWTTDAAKDAELAAARFAPSVDLNNFLNDQLDIYHAAHPELTVARAASCFMRIAAELSATSLAFRPPAKQKETLTELMKCFTDLIQHVVDGMENNPLTQEIGEILRAAETKVEQPDD